MKKGMTTRWDKINAQIAKLEAESESAMKAERANVLAKMKADMKLYDLKKSDFNGILPTRAKQVLSKLSQQKGVD